MASNPAHSYECCFCSSWGWYSPVSEQMWNLLWVDAHGCPLSCAFLSQPSHLFSYGLDHGKHSSSSEVHFLDCGLASCCPYLLISCDREIAPCGKSIDLCHIGRHSVGLLNAPVCGSGHGLCLCLDRGPVLVLDRSPFGDAASSQSPAFLWSRYDLPRGFETANVVDGDDDGRHLCDFCRGGPLPFDYALRRIRCFLRAMVSECPHT